MSITYTWQIDGMRRGSTSGGVFEAEFTLTANTTNHNESFTDVAYFAPDTTDSSFVSYTSLTEDTVIGWVKASKEGQLAKERITLLMLKLEDDISEGLPWSA